MRKINFVFLIIFFSTFFLLANNLSYAGSTSFTCYGSSCSATEECIGSSSTGCCEGYTAYGDACLVPKLCDPVCPPSCIMNLAHMHCPPYSTNDASVRCYILGHDWWGQFPYYYPITAYWDASEQKCVACNGPTESNIYGGKSWLCCGSGNNCPNGDAGGGNCKPAAGDNKFERACGASLECDEKSPGDACGSGSFCDNNGNCIAPPTCTISANPSSGTGPFDSTLTATFSNLPAGTASATIKCNENDQGTSVSISNSKAQKTCSYPQVSSQTTYKASAAASTASCSATITSNPPTCTYSLSIIPSSDNPFSDTSKKWTVQVADSSSSSCSSPITYSIEKTSESGLCGPISISPSVSVGRSSTSSFEISITRGSTACTVNLEIKDPNGQTRATGSYTVSPANVQTCSQAGGDCKPDKCSSYQDCSVAQSNYDCASPNPNCCVGSCTSLAQEPCDEIGKCYPETSCNSNKGTIKCFCIKKTDYDNNKGKGWFKDLGGDYSCGANNCCIANKNNEGCWGTRGYCYDYVSDSSTGCGIISGAQCAAKGGTDCVEDTTGYTLVDPSTKPPYGPYKCVKTSGECSCTSWSNVGCGVSPCSANQMKQTRTCTPSGCSSESNCLDPSYGSPTKLGCGIPCGSAGTCAATEQCNNKIDINGCASPIYTCDSDSACGGIPSQPLTLECKECQAGSKCECELTTTCAEGMWIIKNKERKPLQILIDGNIIEKIIVENMPPIKVDYMPNATGKVEVIAICFKPEPIRVNRTTVEVKEEFLKCPSECQTFEECSCKVSDCKDGRFQAFLGDTVLKNEKIATTSYTATLIPKNVGTVEVSVYCYDPVKEAGEKIPVTGEVPTTTTISTTTTTLETKFTVNNFACSPSIGHKCSLDYSNNYGTAYLVFYFSDTGGKIVYSSDPVLIGLGTGSKSADFDCSNKKGKYFVSWTAFTDSSLKNPISGAWPKPEDRQEITC